MISSIFQNTIGSFTRAGQKLSEVSDAANLPEKNGDLSGAILNAKAAEVEAKASAKVAKVAGQMEKDLLDIIA
jgi:hypothetical protein